MFSQNGREEYNDPFPLNEKVVENGILVGEVWRRENDGDGDDAVGERRRNLMMMRMKETDDDGDEIYGVEWFLLHQVYDLFRRLYRLCLGDLDGGVFRRCLVYDICRHLHVVFYRDVYYG